MTNFKNYFANLESNGEGNKNMASFTNALSGDTKEDTKTATYDAHCVAMGADAEERIVLIHSIKNWEDHCVAQKIRLRPWLGWAAIQQECSSRTTAFANKKRKKLQELRSFKNVNQMKNVRLSRVFQTECVMPQTFFDDTLVSASTE